MNKIDIFRMLQPPPANAGDDHTWRLWLARLVVLAVIAADLIYTPLIFFADPFPGLSLFFNVLLLAAGLLTLLWMRGGQIQPAISWWLLAQWAYLLAGLLTGGGVRSMFISSFILLALVGGLLLDRRRFIRFSLFGLLTVLGVMLLDVSRPAAVDPAAYSPMYFWLGILINLSLACVLLYLYGRTINYNHERLRRELLERLAVESALRQSQERYRNFIEHSFEGVWMVEFDEPIPANLPSEEQVSLICSTGYIAECNDALAEMVGYEHRFDLLGLRLLDMLGDPPPSQYQQVLTDLVCSDYQCSDQEIDWVIRQGEAKIFMMNLVGIRENGCLTGIWGSQRDITARRKMQLALQRRTDQLASLNRISNAVSTIKDLNGVLMEVLNRLKTALPLDVFYVALYDEPARQVFYPLVFDSDAFWAVPPAPLDSDGWLNQVFSTGEPVQLNRTPEEIERVQAGTGPTRIGNVKRASASLMAAPLQIGSRMIGALSVQSYQRDAYDAEHLEFISLASLPVAIAIDNARLYEDLEHELQERQKAEATLQSFNAELEKRVVERTAQLEKAVHELEAFSYSVSHDLRAPLRAIDGYSRFLMEDYSARLDQEGMLFLENVRKAAQRMGILIDDLLNLSRVGRLELHFQPVPLSELAGDILDTLRSREPHRRLEVVIEPNLTVIGDSHLLRLALENLMENAWKFTGNTPDARIEFGSLERDNLRAFYVRDNGAGFDMRYVAKLFKPFSRLHGVEEFEGTGIGLASVKRVIDRHGGSVWAEANLNHGATFYFTIPDAGSSPQN